jgi:cell division septation protein DedD
MKYRVIETRRRFYIEQQTRENGALVWVHAVGPIPTREEAEELALEMRVDALCAAEDRAESGLGA